MFFKKKIHKISMIIMLLFLMIPSVHSYIIHGKVYDQDYNILPKVKVYIDTTPIQILVTENGTFSFNVTKNKYILSATYKDELYTWQEIIIEGNKSSHYVDLVLEPRNGVSGMFMLSLMSILILLVLGWAYPKYKKEKKRKTLLLAKKEKSDKYALRDDLKQLVSFLDKNNGRASQTEIVKELYLSKAKVSLMITELEDKGIIRKIKKGRTNVIILN